MTAEVPPTHRVVTMAGHVDHGKSTLLRALTGMEPDRLPEERLRGRTIELGFLWADLEGPSTRVAFVDVPGHARLVGTMIAGSGVSPAALLVVAADDGPAVQTREHLGILDLLGVPGIAVAITKVDRVEPERIAAVEEEVRALTSGTTFAAAPFIQVVGPDGRGIDRLRHVLRTRLAELPLPVDDRGARLWVDRAFSVDGSGTVVTGTLADGPLHRGDQVGLLPGGARARVRRLQQLGADVEVAAPGTRVAANLVGLGVAAVRRGDVLVVGEPAPLTTRLDASVRLVHGELLERTTVLRLHCGTAVRTCRVRPLLVGAARDTGGPIPVRITPDGPLAVRVGDRFILREPGRGRTLGGGVVVDPDPPGRSNGKDRVAQAAAVVAVGDRLLGVRDLRAVQSAWLSLAPGVRRVEAVSMWTGGPPVELVPIGGFVADGSAVEAATELLLSVAVSGGSIQTASEALVAQGLPREAADAVIEHARHEGKVIVDGGTLARPGTGDARADERARRRETLVLRFEAAALDPPDLLTVARELEVDHLERQAILASGALVRCGDLTLAGRTVEDAVRVLRDLQTSAGPFTASQARIALGTTRRVLIPLLEHLVRTGRTRFDGARHRIVER